MKIMLTKTELRKIKSIAKAMKLTEEALASCALKKFLENISTNDGNLLFSETFCKPNQKQKNTTKPCGKIQL